ncbi:MAG: DNA cytosine methyltransferase [Devosia sp.]
MTDYRFADLFAGCGGLSTGLIWAGLRGVFAVEKDAMAFETFRTNLVEHSARAAFPPFEWPSWLPVAPLGIDDLLETHGRRLRSMRGKIDVLAGGPPCQGFSPAGRRSGDDPRNLMFERYVATVDAVRPAALVVENVPGMKAKHKGQKKDRVAFSELLIGALQQLGYDVRERVVDASTFGVPQRRERLIIVGLRRDVAKRVAGGADAVFAELEIVRRRQLHQLRLAEATSVKAAISDLETEDRFTVEYRDERQKLSGYEQLVYSRPTTPYQRLMHRGVGRGAMDSMRMVKHRRDIRDRFERILGECAKGAPMTDDARKRFGLKKQRIHLMAGDLPSPTITTLPDDILHYSEPRILTVRESARLQSFPDWFVFRGKYTTGGSRRVHECPRYTQVGNAVPPLLGRALGLAISQTLDKATAASTREASEQLEGAA